MMKINQIRLEGNQNIVIQDVSGNSRIYVNQDEGVRKLLNEQAEHLGEILDILKQKQEPVFQQFAEKIYNIGVIHNANFFINQHDEKVLSHALQTWWDRYTQQYLFVVILTSVRSEIEQEADFQEISHRYGENPNDWKPYQNEKAILELLEEYKQEAGFTVKGLLINQSRFANRKEFLRIKDAFAKKLILVTDGIAILKKENKDWRNIFDQKDVGGLLLPICEKSTPKTTKKAILDTFGQEMEETFGRFYSMWNEAYINIELDIPTKNLFFRRLSNMAIKTLDIKPIADMSSLNQYASPSLQSARPDA